MNHHRTTTLPSKVEAERLLSKAENHLQTGDLSGSREFALLAQETDPLLEGSDQILAITDVLLASKRRVVNNRHHDWYSILQTDPHSIIPDPDLLKRNYRRLALLLHPDKNRFPLADSAFKLVSDAWGVLSDPSKRGLYDHELNAYENVELRRQPPPEKDKLPVRRSGTGGVPSTTPVPLNGGFGTSTRSRAKSAERTITFWTACPYCYVLYEYPRAYEDCCLRCQNCERAYHGTVIDSLPPLVPGKEAYYCCWGFFPLGFSLESNPGTDSTSRGDNLNSNSVFPEWTPADKSSTPVAAAAVPQGGGAATPGAKKRGRPRKNQ